MKTYEKVLCSIGAVVYVILGLLVILDNTGII